MKIDRRKPGHWVVLAAFLACVTVAAAVRPFVRRHRPRRRVLLYGHKLAGNLLPLALALRRDHGDEVEVRFLTMDRAYQRALQDAGEPALFAASLPAIRYLATADAIVSDHGLHALQVLLSLSDIRFFDVWHGIPFKGFDADDFGIQRRFDEAWVASPYMAQVYRDRFGFDPARIAVTGYSRTDILIDRSVGIQEVRREVGLPANGKVLLFAPTWHQDDPRRSPCPFGIDPERFVDLLSRVALRNGATAVIRGHLNSPGIAFRERPGVVNVPFEDYPWTERLLLATDVLVCDWSSIAFDFLLLDRPAIFLDVPPPFAKGMTLDGSWRYGEVVGSPQELERALDAAIADPASYWRARASHACELRERLYGGMDDGKATGRCVARLLAALRQ